MFLITLKNGVNFQCSPDSTIFEAAKNSGIVLEHSCLKARCRTCAVQIKNGSVKNKLDDLVLSTEEKAQNWILSCNAVPLSDLTLNTVDLEGIQLHERKIVPAKINSIERVNDSVIEVRLRLPAGTNFKYNSGQYVNVIKNQIVRSYSIANSYSENGYISFLIRKFEDGVLSNYWFNNAQVNDLLRIEGPLGSFFLRDTTVRNIFFLVTGTGVAPVKAILESILKSRSQYLNKRFWLLVGARNVDDLIWSPNYELMRSIDINYVPVLSRSSSDWMGERGYIQDVIEKLNISFVDSQVYACGSSEMIESVKKLLFERGLEKVNFFSDAFVATS